VIRGHRETAEKSHAYVAILLGVPHAVIDITSCHLLLSPCLLQMICVYDNYGEKVPHQSLTVSFVIVNYEKRTYFELVKPCHRK